MEGCGELTSIDLAPLVNLETIGNSFITCNVSLTTIDLTPLSSVTSIGVQYFLGNYDEDFKVVYNGSNEVVREALAQRERSIAAEWQMTVEAGEEEETP